MSLTADDRLEILDLCARYYLALNDKDLDAFMDCWADGKVALENMYGTFTDRAAIRAFHQGQLGHGVLGRVRRLACNVHVRPGEQAGTACVTCDIVYVETARLPQVVGSGRFQDSKVAKTPKGWKFVWRKLEMDPGYRQWLQGTLPGGRP